MVVQEAKIRTIPISVNSKPVNLVTERGDREFSGREIKAAAIEQGIAIQADFNLFKINERKLIPVDDAEEIKVRAEDKFRAVAPDDNS